MPGVNALFDAATGAIVGNTLSIGQADAIVHPSCKSGVQVLSGDVALAKSMARLCTECTTFFAREGAEERGCADRWRWRWCWLGDTGVPWLPGRCCGSWRRLEGEGGGWCKDNARDLENILNVKCLTHGLLRVHGDEAREHGGLVVRVEAVPEQGIALLLGYVPSVIEMFTEQVELSIVNGDIFIFAHPHPSRVRYKVSKFLPALRSGVNIR
jgi:hypothetical protein